jgi:hypothetical protein
MSGPGTVFCFGISANNKPLCWSESRSSVRVTTALFFGINNAVCGCNGTVVFDGFPDLLPGKFHMFIEYPTNFLLQGQVVALYWQVRLFLKQRAVIEAQFGELDFNTLFD